MKKNILKLAAQIPLYVQQSNRQSLGHTFPINFGIELINIMPYQLNQNT